MTQQDKKPIQILHASYHTIVPTIHHIVIFRHAHALLAQQHNITTHARVRRRTRPTTTPTSFFFVAAPSAQHRGGEMSSASSSAAASLASSSAAAASKTVALRDGELGRLSRGYHRLGRRPPRRRTRPALLRLPPDRPSPFLHGGGFGRCLCGRRRLVRLAIPLPPTSPPPSRTTT